MEIKFRRVYELSNVNYGESTRFVSKKFCCGQMKDVFDTVIAYFEDTNSVGIIGNNGIQNCVIKGCPFCLLPIVYRDVTDEFSVEEAYAK